MKQWKLTEEQMEARKAGRMFQWTPEQLARFKAHRDVTEEPPHTFTDGCSDMELLSFLESHAINPLMTEAEMERQQERLAQRRIGLTLDQKKRLNFLTNGEFKIEVEEHGY